LIAAGILLATACSGCRAPASPVLFATLLLVFIGAVKGSAQPAEARKAAKRPHRRQQWLLPSPDLGPPMHALLYDRRATVRFHWH
jgi:hypothetical protein